MSERFSGLVRDDIFTIIGNPSLAWLHLKIFSQRFLRAFPNADFHWKLEFQARGAAHFHPIFWNLGSDREFLREFRGWLARNWYEVVGSGDERHLAVATSADLIKSQFGIMRYVSAYVSDADQTKPGCKVGRYCGIVGRTNIPWATENVMKLSVEQGKLVRRMARHYMQAMNRQRRIRHLAKFWPKQMCAAAMLSGDFRRIRKVCSAEDVRAFAAQASLEEQWERERVL